MKQSHILLQVSLFAILFFISNSCAPNLRLSVVIPETPTQQEWQVFLMTSEEFDRIQSIITRNNAYFHKKLRNISDSLTALNRDYKVIATEFKTVSQQCSTLLEELPRQYCEKIKIEPVQIAKYGDVWRVTSHITNLGDEDVWGLIMSVKFQDQYIVRQTEFPIFIQPKQRFLYHQISFDLSANMPLQYSMATYPGGLNALLREALTVEVDSVRSMFVNAMEECRTNLTRLKRRMEAKSIETELYKENISEYLYQTAINPINRIIEQNLRNTNFQTKVSTADTIVFENVKKEMYHLFSYIDVDSTDSHYLIPVDFTSSDEFIINIQHQRPRTLFLDRDRFIDRQKL